MAFFVCLSHLSSLSHQQCAINNFWDSWTSTSWKATSSFAGVIPERDTLIDVGERQEQSNSMTEGKSRMAMAQAVPSPTRVQCHCI